MKTTEESSNHQDLENKTVLELLDGINREDCTVANAVNSCIPFIGELCEVIIKKLENGGRLFYIGSGTSGRLGVLDASECPPTYGVPHGFVVGIIAGGDGAIRMAVENAEDDTEQGWKDLEAFKVNSTDVVIGLSASGSTPYVIGALEKCKENNIVTGAIVCNSGSSIEELSDYPIAVIVGPEYVTGSTRMKSGTAQKLVLNMITTTVMIRRGHVIGNKMVDMQLSNAKLVDRGVKMICSQRVIDYETAKSILLQEGSVRLALTYLDK
jgi:N-acetylmuramic acid 6-phosphate etherase